MKKIGIYVLASVLMITAASCSGSKIPANETTEDVSKMPVVGKDGTRLGEIDSRAVCSASDAGIFYSIFELKENKYTATAEYRLFNKADNSDVLLGKFEDQGYEAFYTRTELNGIIYTLAVQGKPGDKKSPLVLLAFNPADQTMKTYTVAEPGFPYTDMAAVNGKLLIMNHELSGQKDMVYEFNPADESVKEVLSFSSDKDSLRGICTADNGFYLLRLKINNGNENEMFVDLYDNEYKKSSEQSVNEAMVNAIKPIHGMQGRQDALNEIGMNVVNFTILDGRYMLYENFAIARVCVDLQTGEPVISKDDIYSISIGNGQPVMYRQDFDPEVTDPEIIGFVKGNTINILFKPIESHKLVRAVSTSESGTWVVMTSDDSRAANWTLAVHLWTES